MKIIYLKPEHWEAFRQMRVHALKHEPDLLFGDWEEVASRPASYWKGILSDPKSKIMGLMNDNKMVGMSAIIPYFDDDIEDAAYLCWMYVLPKFRGGGHGRDLTRARIDWVRHSEHYKSVCVMCRDTNIPSQRIYKKLGFKYSHEIDSQYADGMGKDYVYVLAFDED